MERETKNKILYFIVNAIFSILLSNLGIIALSENKYIGIITILIALILLYFSFKAFQIKKNEEKIKEIEEEIENLKQNQELNWKLLNSSMNNKLIDKISRLLKMNKKGLSDTDILEVIKIIVLIIVGYIIVKALLTAA